jgi:hypothetical protein
LIGWLVALPDTAEAQALSLLDAAIATAKR